MMSSSTPSSLARGSRRVIQWRQRVLWATESRISSVSRGPSRLDSRTVRFVSRTRRASCGEAFQARTRLLAPGVKRPPGSMVASGRSIGSSSSRRSGRSIVQSSRVTGSVEALECWYPCTRPMINLALEGQPICRGIPAATGYQCRVCVGWRRLTKELGLTSGFTNPRVHLRIACEPDAEDHVHAKIYTRD